MSEGINRLWDAIQEVSEDTGSTLLEVMIALMQEAIEREKGDKRESEQRSRYESHIQEQADELSTAVLSNASGIYELGKRQHETSQEQEKYEYGMTKLKREVTELRAKM